MTPSLRIFTSKLNVANCEPQPTSKENNETNEKKMDAELDIHAVAGREPDLCVHVQPSHKTFNLPINDDVISVCALRTHTLWTNIDCCQYPPRAASGEMRTHSHAATVLKRAIPTRSRTNPHRFNEPAFRSSGVPSANSLDHSARWTSTSTSARTQRCAKARRRNTASFTTCPT